VTVLLPDTVTALENRAEGEDVSYMLKPMLARNRRR
jgi:hypothetical protein